MKNFEDKLREAGKEWQGRSEASVSNTGQQILQRMKIQRFVKYGVGGAASLSVVALVAWMGINYAGATNTAPAPVVSTPTEYPVDAIVSQDVPTRAPAVALVHKAPVAKQSKEVELSTKTEIANQPFVAEVSHQSFDAEYNRVLARAQRFAQVDHLVAASEYRGLAKLCARNQRLDLARTSLAAARDLAEKVGDSDLQDKINQEFSQLD